MPINSTHNTVSTAATATDFTSTDAPTEKPKKGGFASLLKNLNCCHVSLSDMDTSSSSTSLSSLSSLSSEFSRHGKQDASDQAGTSQRQYSEKQAKRSLTLLIDRFKSSHDPKLSKMYKNNSTKDIIATTLATKDATHGANQLTDSEYLGLRLYSSSLYRPINHHLRYEHKDDVPPVVDAMVSGLKKLSKNPEHQVNDYVYRGIAKKMSEAEVNQRFKTGEVYRDEAFVSASYDLTVADNFTRQIQLRIESKTGVNLKDISRVPREKEAIFAPNTPFLVKEVVHDPTDPPTWVVDLQEIDPDVAADMEKAAKSNQT